MYSSLFCCDTAVIYSQVSVVGQMRPKARCRPAPLSRPHWQHQDFVPTELETAFLKYKWRLVTVLIDGALQQRGAKIDERHMESGDWGLKSDACDAYPPEHPRAHS